MINKHMYQVYTRKSLCQSFIEERIHIMKRLYTCTCKYPLYRDTLCTCTIIQVSISIWDDTYMYMFVSVFSIKSNERCPLHIKSIIIII